MRGEQKEMMMPVMMLYLTTSGLRPEQNNILQYEPEGP